MDKMAAISQKIFLYEFWWIIISYFDSRFLSKIQTGNKVSIGSSNDLAPSSDKPLYESILDQLAEAYMRQ